MKSKTCLNQRIEITSKRTRLFCTPSFLLACQSKVDHASSKFRPSTPLKTCFHSNRSHRLRKCKCTGPNTTNDSTSTCI